MSDCFQLILGPPAYKELCAEFYAHQENREGDTPWKLHEQFVADSLFGHDADEPSFVEKVYLLKFGQRITILDHRLAMGFHRGYWVLPILIPADGVYDEFGHPLDWTGNNPNWNRIGNIVHRILDREWIFCLSPSIDTEVEA
ncbi:MAG TPA: hypothetical protein EYQ69_07375 [Gemmatimonadetes bacterium]|nr:hypothetical protein [Gemmatimonadota bacterium]